MADFTFNIALGRVRTYADLGAASDALILVPLESSGIEADATMRDHDDLAALLAAASTEQTTIGRQTLANVTVTVDDTANDLEITADDISLTAPTGNAVGSWLVCYDGDTGAGTDADIVPVLKFDQALTPDGNNVTVSFTPNLFSA